MTLHMPLSPAAIYLICLTRIGIFYLTLTVLLITVTSRFLRLAIQFISRQAVSLWEVTIKIADK